MYIGELGASRVTFVCCLPGLRDHKVEPVIQEGEAGTDGCKFKARKKDTWRGPLRLFLF